MPRNKLTDLNNHLFEQLERLNDEDLIDEALDKEIKRSKAVVNISKAIISNASLVLEAKKYVTDWDLKNKEVPEMLQIENKKGD